MSVWRFINLAWATTFAAYDFHHGGTISVALGGCMVAFAIYWVISAVRS